MMPIPGFLGLSKLPVTASLSLAVVQTSANVDITAQGFSDWGLWSSADAGGSQSPSTRKSGGGSLIPNPVLQGGGGWTGYVGDPRTLTWTDGTPTASGSLASGIYRTSGASGAGYTMTFPADTTLRIVKIYFGFYSVRVKVTSTMTGGGVTTQSDNSCDGTGSQDGTATITYRAASAGQTMTVTVEVDPGHTGGNVTLCGVGMA